MMKYRSSFLGLALLTLSACDNDPVGDAAKSEATAPVAEVSPTKVSESTIVMDLNPENTKVQFVGAKITGKHEGQFDEPSGKLTWDAGDPTKSQVVVSIAMDSFATDSAKLDGHLRSPDFFDVAQFPMTSFTSTKIVKKGEDYLVTGNLDLHGVKKSISFPAQVSEEGGVLKIGAEFGINRKDFGIVYPGKPDDLIKDEVLIKLDLKPKKP